LLRERSRVALRTCPGGNGNLQKCPKQKTVLRARTRRQDGQEFAVLQHQRQHRIAAGIHISLLIDMTMNTSEVPQNVMNHQTKHRCHDGIRLEEFIYLINSTSAHNRPAYRIRARRPFTPCWHMPTENVMTAWMTVKPLRARFTTGDESAAEGPATMVMFILMQAQRAFMPSCHISRKTAPPEERQSQDQTPEDDFANATAFCRS